MPQCSASALCLTLLTILSIFPALVNAFLPSLMPPGSGSVHRIHSTDLIGTTSSLFQSETPTESQEESHTTPEPSSSTTGTSKRVRFLNKLGFLGFPRGNKEAQQQKKKAAATGTSSQQYNVTTVPDLQAYFTDEAGLFRNDQGDIDYDALIRALNVVGDTQRIGAPVSKAQDTGTTAATEPVFTHAVTQLLHERRRQHSQPGQRNDAYKVALAIEGGGMRGCVSAGMICAIHHLNLTDSLDAVYGSSAGTVVGSYLITGQLPWFGPEVYYDRLTTAGRKFIDTRRLLRAIGFGLVDPRLLKDVLTRREGGKPVLNLPFLLQTTVQDTKPLDWDKFVERQKVQPLKVIASGLKSEKAIVLDMESGAFETLEELTNCMHASCLLPGIAGPLMNFDTRALNGTKIPQKFILGNNVKGDHWEPLADALLYEPLPYRSAIEQGATHVVIVRSRPDGVDVSGKGGIFERLIARRFFVRKNRLPNMYKRLKMHLHKNQYAEDVLRLNEEAHSERDYTDTSRPHLMAIAAPPGSPEVTRLETRREAIFDGFQRGFARAYDCLVEDPAERGRGGIVSKEYFPDEILDYDPLDIEVTHESAFEAYRRKSGSEPESTGMPAAVEDNVALR